MTNVVHLPRHLLADCRRDREPRGSCVQGFCPICCGGLALCLRCGGAEGSLPTDCPGEMMTDAVEALVYAGQLDYVHPRGWVRGSNVDEARRRARR